VTVVGSGPNAGGGTTCGLVVPKLELVGTMQVLLQTQRLKIADSLPEAPVLVRELEVFRAAAPVLRVNGEPVKAAAPAVPRRDHRADQRSAKLGDEQRLRIEGQ